MLETIIIVQFIFTSAFNNETVIFNVISAVKANMRGRLNIIIVNYFINLNLIITVSLFIC